MLAIHNQTHLLIVSVRENSRFNNTCPLFLDFQRYALDFWLFTVMLNIGDTVFKVQNFRCEFQFLTISDAVLKVTSIEFRKKEISSKITNGFLLKRKMANVETDHEINKERKKVIQY